MTATTEPVLVSPSEQYQEAYLEYLDDLRAAGEPLWGKEDLTGSNFAEYVCRLRAESRSEGLPEGWVPQHTFWLLAEGRVLGECRIRLRLTEGLEDHGGHIGYGVQPSARGKGYGTLVLRLALDRARELGLGRVLLTCDADNMASRGVIERHGGQLASESYSERAGCVTRRYWIKL